MAGPRVAELVDRGEEALTAGEWEAARKAFGAAVERGPRYRLRGTRQ
jgi:hypothetical protein